MLRNKWALIGLAVILLFVIVAIFAPLLSPHDAGAIDLKNQLAKPSWAHPLGTDQNGADILSRLMLGARISLSVGIVVVSVTATVGTIVGMIAGYHGGLIDTILMRLVDILLAFPGLLLAIALVAVLGPAIENVVLALTIMGWVGFARLVRGVVLSMKERDFIAAARTSGQSSTRIMRVHIFPNIMSPVLIQATFGVASVIIAESSLSFLGLGAPAGTPTWGAMLSEGKQVLLEAPHVTFFPGFAIMVVVLSFNVLGDALRDVLDPKTEV